MTNQQTNFFLIFLEQINGSSRILEEAFLKVFEEKFDHKNLFDKTIKAFKNLYRRMNNNSEEQELQNKIIFAVDECQTLTTTINCILSISEREKPDALNINNARLYPAIYILLYTLNKLQIGNFVSGINIDYFQIYKKSSSGVLSKSLFILNFPNCTDPFKFISDKLAIEPKVLEKFKTKIELLKGRYRYVTSLILRIIEEVTKKANIKDNFDKILTDTIDSVKNSVGNQIDALTLRDFNNISLLFSKEEEEKEEREDNNKKEEDNNKKEEEKEENNKKVVVEEEKTDNKNFQLIYPNFQSSLSVFHFHFLIYFSALILVKLHFTFRMKMPFNHSFNLMNL